VGQTVSEFRLIEEILQALGDSALSAAVRLGPGDDAAVLAPPGGMELAASIDTLVEGRHFPKAADSRLVGYRALMVSVSDLAAMGAEPGYALVALSVPRADMDWVRGLAQGLRAAALDCDIPIVGGNLTAGPVCISVSVHGWVVTGSAITRSGARPGDKVYVTGELGGAAAALSRGGLSNCRERTDLDALEQRYFTPQPRLAAGVRLRGIATSAIDVSDGLLQDLGHICAASGVGAEVARGAIPVCPGATVDHALSGGDDYELCFTSSSPPPELDCGSACIGSIVSTQGLWVDGKVVEPVGYEHFA
jgi:thiamine-monophosphate kinase